MTNTFYLSSSPEFYGDVTEEQAESIGLAIAEKVELNFEVEVELTNHSKNNSDSDPDGDIQHWINDNWSDIAAEVI